jgi:MFS family permease
MGNIRVESTGAMVRLTLPTVGLSMALSLVTTYLPLTLRRYTGSATLIGFAIGGEGLFALAIPLVVGAVSDRTWTRWGRRRPFMVAAAPVMAVAMALAPMQPGYIRIAACVFVFFAAYHVYTAPYQALIPDSVPYARHGQVQGMQTLMRGLGMFAGMVGAGLLLHQWEPLPYVLASGVLLGVTGITVLTIAEAPPHGGTSGPRQGVVAMLRETWVTSRAEKGVHRFLVANYLWEATVQGVRPFIMLFFLYVWGVQARGGALLLGWVGITYIIGGVSSGFLADRYGRFRVMWGGLCVYGAGCVIGMFVHDVRWAIVLLPLFGAGGAAVLTLPYTIMMALMPPGRLGQFTGLYSLSRGLATVTAPLFVGMLIDVFSPHLPESRGYSVIWPVAAATVGVSMLVFRTVEAPGTPAQVVSLAGDPPRDSPAEGV